MIIGRVVLGDSPKGAEEALVDYPVALMMREYDVNLSYAVPLVPADGAGPPLFDFSDSVGGADLQELEIEDDTEGPLDQTALVRKNGGTGMEMTKIPE